jgi:hypothetical protein
MKPDVIKITEMEKDKKFREEITELVKKIWVTV